MACSQMRIRIDGELLTVDEVRTCASLPMVRCGREEYYRVGRLADELGFTPTVAYRAS